MPDVPGRLERPARVVEPDVHALDQVPGDPDVVVLEDEHPAAELGAARLRPKMSWITPWPGRSAGWALPAKTIWTGRSVVPQQARQPLQVGEQQRGALVGREPAREADRQDRRVEDLLELLERRRRLAVAGELAAQPAAGEDRELQLLALVGLPQLARSGSGRCAPRSGARRAPRPSRRGRRSCTARGRRASAGPTQVGGWTPLVMPRISVGAMPDQVRVGGLARGAARRRWRRWSCAARTRSCRTGSGRRRRRGPAPAARRSGCRRSRAGRRRRTAGPRPAGRGPRRTARCRPRPACGS